MKTRDRILVAARTLFNARRFGNVTTADLAAETGISEGNLWYHFKSKRALLEALSEQFLHDVEQRLAMLPSGGPDILDEYAGMLDALSDEIRQYRFLYRDQADYGEHTDALLTRLPGIYRDTLAQFRTFLHGMIKAGHLDLPADRLDTLAMNITVILRYHLEFLRESGGVAEVGSGAIRQSLVQHLSLFDDKLTPDARTQLRRALGADLLPA
ncbi:MAG: TetR/AcrR family transcriptional regulator [Alphaproteobacteria bacterium]|nr:TetR/AcrR family transcriptional regulator [Alphaproteobacteria bacterium]